VEYTDLIIIVWAIICQIWGFWLGYYKAKRYYSEQINMLEMEKRKLREVAVSYSGTMEEILVTLREHLGGIDDTEGKR